MSKKKTDNNKQEPPRSLKNENFYGFNLDEDQRNFIENVWDEDSKIIFCNAKAGSGKTLCALGVANMMYEWGMYDGIVYIMSPVQERKLGFLPGSLESKSAVYIEPLLNAMTSLDIAESMIKSEERHPETLKNGTAYIDAITHTFLRGCNLENKVVIIDEAQNYYLDELKKTLTRIHDSCKCIVIGQVEQKDIIYNKERSGFQHYLKYFEDIAKTDKRARVCHLTHNHRGWISNTCDALYVDFDDDVHTKRLEWRNI